MKLKLNNPIQLLGIIVIVTFIITLVSVTAANAAPAINPALQQDDYFQNLYAVSDTVCCHSNHWDIIVPDLTYAGDWSIFPFGSRSKLADGINVKVKLAASNNGWTESFFIPSYHGDYKNELVPLWWFGTAVDTIAVQAEFSTCAAGSTLYYQFIMQGW
jgi:anaerobic selenocysteine-containing dehydrogenase